MQCAFCGDEFYSDNCGDSNNPMCEDCADKLDSADEDLNRPFESDDD